MLDPTTMSAIKDAVSAFTWVLKLLKTILIEVKTERQTKLDDKSEKTIREWQDQINKSTSYEAMYDEDFALAWGISGKENTAQLYKRLESDKKFMPLLKEWFLSDQTKGNKEEKALKEYFEGVKSEGYPKANINIDKVMECFANTVASDQILAHRQLLIGQVEIKKGVNDLKDEIVTRADEQNEAIATLNQQNANQHLETQRMLGILQNKTDELLRRHPSVKPKSYLYAMLIGSFDDNNTNDREAIAGLVGDFRTWRDELRYLLNDEISQVTKKDNIWIVKDRQPLWQNMGNMVLDDDLEKLQQLIMIVLSEDDPCFELPPDQHGMAFLLDKTTMYSNELRAALVKTLALLGSNNPVLKSCTHSKALRIASGIVYKLLHNANGVRWGSLNRFLPQIAEAAPDVYLKCLEELSTQGDAFKFLLSQEAAPIFGQTYIATVCWSLEILAWEEQYLPRVTLCLGRLLAQDQGGVWLHRPINSLINIFMPYRREQTMASSEKIMVAIKNLIKELPDVAFELLFRFMPSQQQVFTNTERPKYRNTVPKDFSDDTTQDERWDKLKKYSAMLVELAQGNLERTLRLIESPQSVEPNSFTLFVKNTELVIKNSSSPQDKERLYKVLSSAVEGNNRRGNSEDRLENDELDSLIRLQKQLDGDVGMLRFVNLFSYSVKWQPNVDKSSLHNKRQEAIEQIVSAGDMKKLVEFSTHIEDAMALVDLMTIEQIRQFTDYVLPDVVNREFADNIFNNDRVLIGGSINRRIENEGYEWFDKWLNLPANKELIIRKLFFLPFGREQWNRAERLLGDDIKEFWQQVLPFAHIIDNREDLLFAAEQLLAVENGLGAIHCLNRIIWEKMDFAPDLGIKALDVATKQLIGLSGYQKVDPYSIQELIKYLQENASTNEDDLCSIELRYMPFLNAGDQVWPKTLEYRMANDPEFFCSIIDIQKEQVSNTGDSESENSHRAWKKNCYTMLTNWRIVPGTQRDGTFSGDALTKWFEKVYGNYKESNFLRLLLSILGHVFIYSSPNQEGLWLHTAVADILNRVDMEELRNGYQITLRYSRGMHRISAKGDEALAEKYKQYAEDADKHGYPYLAGSMRELGNWYRHDADRTRRVYGDC